MILNYLHCKFGAVVQVYAKSIKSAKVYANCWNQVDDVLSKGEFLRKLELSNKVRRLNDGQNKKS